MDESLERRDLREDAVRRDRNIFEEDCNSLIASTSGKHCNFETQMALPTAEMGALFAERRTIRPVGR
jgi:hypothetical protein